MKQPKFNIGQRVYHVIPESECGVVINIKFDYLTGLHEYQVAFSASAESIWYYEHELSTDKIF